MPTTSEQRGPLHVREINRARQFYNPLVGLDIPRLRQLLEQGERGLNSSLQDLYRIAEKRHATLLALKTRRIGAVKKLDWDIKIPSRLPKGITQSQAEAQADYLRDAYEKIENLTEAVDFLAQGSFRGYSHLEKHYEDENPNLPVVKLQPVPQWHMLRSQENWSWVYDATARNNVSTAVPIDPTNFIIREVEAPLDEIGVICFLRSSMAEKDWSSFIEDFGIPAIFAMLAPTTPLDKVKEWLEVAQRVTGNSRGALPPGSDVKFATPNNADGAAFEKFLKHQDEVLVLAGTCGLLTMLAQSGSGTLAGSAHQEAFDVLALAEAKEVTSVFQAQNDKPLLSREFPSQPQAAYFELAALDDEDLDALSKRLQYLAAASLIADPKEISEKLGITLTRGTGAGPGTAYDDQPAPAGGKAMTNRLQAEAAGKDAIFKANAAAQELAARREVFRPIANRLAAIDAIADPAARRAAVEQFRADSGQLYAAVVAQAPDLARPLEEAIGTALVSGFADATEARRPVLKRGRNKALGAKTPTSPAGTAPDAS